MKRIITLFTALALILSICIPAYAAPASAAEPTRASSALTPVKISAPDPTYKDESYSYAERAVDLVSRMTEQEKISQTEGYNSPAIARLGVATYMWWNEALHGYNQEGWFGIQTDGSSFPSSYSMGASWDPKIYYQEAVQIGAEIRERVKQNRYNLTMFSPTINLGRDPRWGRNDEGYGEDPFVTGMLASSFVNGVEGKTIDGEFIRTNANGEGVKQAGTTIKHYAANNSEKNRYTSGADNVTVREMREYYTRAARIVAAKADVSSVMMAYSSVSGFPISFSSYYMDTVLRQTYGFSGYIVSDCDSVAVSYNRSVHKNNPHTGENYNKGEAFANALANGLDLQCNAGETDSLGSYASNYEQLKAEPDGSPVKTDKGYFTEQQAEVSVARLMTQRMKLGEFDEDNFYATEGKARLDAGNDGNYVNGVAGQTQERIDLADELSRATIVLLQNENNALPITAGEINAADGYDVAIVGPVGQSNFRGGYSSTLRNEANVVTIEQAIKTAFADTETYPQATVDNVNIAYYYGFSSNVNRNSFTGLQSSQIAVDDVAENLDLAIVVVGQGSGDSREDGDRMDLNLQQAQIDMLNAIKAKNPKKLVLVMETYGPVQMVSDLTEGVDAILWSGFNGFRKGTGFGEAITGKNNPSGRMNATWLKDMIADTPGFFDYSLFPSNGNGGRTYMYNVEDTIYPFGFGLSYSDFQYVANGSILGAASKGGLVLGTADAPITKDSTIDVSFQIKNNNAVAGKQVAEVYVVSPGAGTNNYPLKRLVGFDKVEVGANATVDVTIPVKVTDFGFFNEEKDCYELPTGTWQIWVAFSSDLNEATDLVENFTVQNGAIREDPVVVTVKPTQPGDSEKGISERVLFDLSADASKNIINPGVAVTMANEKLYGVRVVKNVPGEDIGVDPAAATEAGGDFANPDTAASLPRLQAGKSADELPHVGTKFVLPDSYKVDYSSNRPSVVAVENGQFVMKGIGVATLTVKVTGPSGEFATEEFTVGVEAEPGLESITVGETKYKKFDPKNYGVNVAVPIGTRADAPGLEVNAVAAEGAKVEYLSKAADGSFVPNETRTPDTIPGTVYVRVTGDDIIEQIYEVNFAGSEAVKPVSDGEYVLASGIEVGKQYVIVADGDYALTNRQEGPALRTYAGGATTSLASAPVAVVNGKIVSVVNDDMLWTVEESTAPAAYDGQPQYFLKDAAGNYLRRGSGSSGQGAQLLAEPNLYSTIRYNAFSFYPYEDGSGYAMYANSERAYGTDYPFYVYGNETTFDSPGRAQRDEADPFAFTRNDDCSHITLYEYAPVVGGGENIDFTNPADESKYEVITPDTYALVEGTGVKLTPTADAFEPVSGGCGGDATDSAPKDLIRVPVTGDWTATLNLEYDQAGAATAGSTYYAFLGMVGDDYQDMAGIRGTGTASQDFLRQEGVIMDPVAPGIGFTDSGLYWIQLTKAGTTYSAAISTDGVEYTDLFEIEDTDIEAEYIVLDAYKTSSSTWGSQAVWNVTLKSLTFGEGAAPVPSVNKAALKAAIAEAAEVAKDEYTADSVAALEAAVAAAEAVRDNAAATQEEVDDAAQAVRDAIAALVKEDKADTAALEAAIAAAEAVERGKYTDESLTALDAALAEARTTLAESRLQAVIDTAAQALNDAIAALVEKTEPEDPIDPTIPIFENPQYSFEERAADLIGRMTLSQKASEITSQSAPAISAAQLGGGALNVPATKGLGGYTWWSETLHGTRGGVNYPQNTTVASTWNPDLYYQESTNIGQEIRERNNTNLNFYSPTINMHRDPRWGRNEESYSEDVYLTAKMGIAWVQGLEGKDREGNVLDPDGYLMAHATIKHYVANNNEGKNSGDTTGRLRAGAISSLRMLREYYALPYGEIIRGADVSSVMTAYNYFGVEPGKFDPSSYSSYLMDTLLRQVYGFNGHITSDCDSVCSMQNLHYTNYYTGKEITAAEAMAGALAHGEDLECNGGHSSTGSGTSGFHTSYGAQMNNMLGLETDKGIFTENTVDIALHRLMTARFQTGDFDGDIQIKKDAAARNSNTLRDTVRRPLVEQINAEGVVMLQNKGILPLDLSETGVKSVVIVGSYQTNGNTGLYAQASGNQLNIQGGIRDAINAKKEGVTLTYITSNSLTDENRAVIEAADVAIVVTGTTSGYSAEDRDRASIILPDNQETLISTVGKLNPNTIAIMETCGPMRVRTFQDDVNAILWSSFEGQWKTGFGQVITGAVNPSGKVTDTWYQDVADTGESDVPPVTDYDLVPSEGKNGRTYMYYEGYLGTRAAKAPSYPFGFGLSYTTFEYSNLKIDKTAYDANETVKVSFDVKNTGSVAGKETTQLYVAQPDAPAELKRPIRRLEGFEKIDLQPGETKTVSMEVKIEDLAFFDEAADCFLIDQGKYQVQVGTNSAAANLTADFTVSGQVTEVPAVLTVKANQVGDGDKGIEQRLIFEKNKEINPQVTVAMNNEKLYGYIIAQQHSNIKSMQSCPLPEGMKVSYKSNRSSVVKVVGDKVYTAAPGVATLTVTATYNGVTVSGDAIIYVMSSTDVDDITVNGQSLEKFNPKKYSYSMTLEAGSAIPEVAAIASNPDLDVVVTQASELPGVATVVATDRDSGVASTYTITFKVKKTNVGGYILADTVESGKQYVIVSNGYALTNEVADVSTAYGGVSLASTPVTVENDMIVSGVTAEMIWDFTAATSSSNNGFEEGFILTSGDSKFLSRNGPTNGNPAPLDTKTYDDSNYDTKPQYAYWVVKDLDEEGNKAVFCTGTGEWSFALRGAEAGFDAPGNSSADTIASQNPLKLYEVVGAAGLPDIDFTTIADSGKYEIVNQAQSEVEEGEGLALIATTQAFEDCKGQLSGDQATTPADVVMVPVSGDWTATLEVDFDTNGAANGYYQFFGFYAAQGDDFQNLAGIRGGDGAMQNFIREDGTITHQDEDGVNSAPGFASIGTYFLRIEKEGDTYTCYRSDDGEDFTEMFAYEGTGMEADYIVIDAYTGMTQNYKFTLKALTFEGGSSIPEVYAPEVASITVDGKDIGFDPAIANYNITVERGAAAPVVAAVAGNKGTTVEVQQISDPTGTAVVTATAGARTKTYTLSFNYKLESDYFADGDYAADQWTIINKDEAAFSVEKGKGIVMPTQTPNIYQGGSGWKNAFATPAMSNWEAVVKVVYPVKPTVNYQQAQVLLWQDEDNYLRLNCQSQTRSGEPTLIIEPGRETNGTFSAAATTTIEAAADNTVTLYFKFKRDGSDYTGAYSLDGSEFTECLTASGVNYVNPQLVLFSSMNEEGEPVDTYYEYVYVAARDGLQPDFVEMLSWAAQNAADYIAADIPAETSEDIVFSPAPHGYTVAIASSDPAVIAADGKVTPADVTKNVQVTVTVSEGDTVASAVKTVRVPGSGAEELDKVALEAAIAAAEAIDTSKYTDESVAAMNKALDDAKAARNADTQAAIDAAAAALNAAVAALVEKPVGPVYHTVTFDFNFPGAPDPVLVQVLDGETVQPIEAPARDGYVFQSWGTEMSFWGMVFIRTYNFETPVTADLTLKASWGKDWSKTYSLAEEYRDFFPFGNFGTQSPNGDQVTYEYNTYSGNSGKMTYNFGESQSKAAYDAAVAEINARTDITDAEKAALIKEADGKVLLGDNNPLANDLNRIRAWNEEHPEGPKKVYRQHVLFWHGSEQNPAFYHEGFDREKPLVSKEVMNARIDSYVEQMFKRYQEWDDIIISWDVVNEALDDYTGMVRNGWNGSSWGETQLDDASNQSSAWGTIYRMKDAEGNPVMEQSEERLQYESEWIRQAFASARKWQQELGVHWTLYYNDYMNSSMLYEPKMTNTLKMLKPISEAGNLDGYGMQARLATAYPTIDMLRGQIEKGLELAPEVSFSEGDVRTDFEVNPLYDPSKPTRRVQEGDEEYEQGGSGSWSMRSQQNGNTYDVSNGPVRRRENFNANDPDIMREQADYYADLMDIMLEKADLGKVGAIAIDGTSDGNTFNRNTGCQIWDSSSNEKPAFYAVIGAPNRFKMGKAIEAGPARSEQSKYTPETWIPYAAALKAAEDLVDVRIYDAAGVEAVKAATAALIEATENLRLSGSGPIPEDLEELYRLVLDALARAQAAQKAAEDALKAAQDAAAYDTAALEAAAKAAQDAAKAAQDAAKAAEDAAKAAAESDADAVAKALAAAESAANAADSASEAALAYSAAQRAQAAAEAAKAAAQAAQASTAADKTAAAAAQKAAEDAQAAAEAAQAAAEASDSAAAANAAKAAAQAANAAKAAEAAQVAQQAAEEAEAAAKAAQAKADEAAAQAGSDRAAAEAAKAAAEAAKKAAEAAQKAADDAKDAANKSNADAAKAAADAAEAAAKVADAHQKVADAQAEIAALKAKTEQSAADAAAIQAAAEAAKKAAEEAELGAAKYYAKAELAAAAAKADVPVENKDDFAAAVAAGLAAIEGAEKKADVDKALADALEAIEAACIDDCPSKDFTDVPPYGNWAHAGIDYCVANGLMNGIEEGIFAPNSNTTRAQFTTILYRAANEPEVEYKGVFADVPDGKWYSKAIEWAAANGIVNGVSEDKFNPEGKITREQIAAILYRYSDSPKVDGKLEGFRDADDVSNYAVDAMIWAVSEGIIKGVGEGETVALNPKANATRAQIATIFARFLAE